MKNIFHHSRAFVEKHLPSLKLWQAKHRYHHHLIVALIVVAVAGGSGVALYKKIAKAATVNFTQSSTSLGGGGWTGLDTATPLASHSNVDDRTLWSKYASSTSVDASANGVALPAVIYSAVDDGVFSTSTGSSAVMIPDSGDGSDGSLNLSLGNASGGCNGQGMEWYGPTSTCYAYTSSGFFAKWNNAFPSLPLVTTFNYRVSVDVDLADLDGDGDMDVIMGSSHSVNGGAYGYQNDDINDDGVINGSITWSTNAAWNIAVLGRVAVNVADLDGDGDQDLTLGGLGYQNDDINDDGVINGSITWSANANFNLPNTDVNFSDLVDLDGDGDQDLMINKSAYQNDDINDDGVINGSITWSTNAAWNITGNGNNPSFADMDGDGDKDILIGYNAGFGNAITTYGYQNDDINDDGVINGSITWSANAAWNVTGDSGLIYPSLADLDNDGDQDLMITRNYGHGGGAFNYSTSYGYINRGNNPGAKSIFNFSTVNIPANYSLTAVGVNGPTLKATGTVTVNGTIDSNGVGGGAGGTPTAGNGNSGSGNGAGNGGDATMSGGDCLAANYFGGGGSGGGFGGAGGGISASYNIFGFGGSGGGGGGYYNDGSCGYYGSAGGAGGGILKIVANANIAIGSIGSIKSNGANGGIYGGGGGSGGFLAIVTSGAITNSGSVTANGGSGGILGLPLPYSGGGGYVVAQDSDGVIAGNAPTATGANTGIVVVSKTGFYTGTGTNIALAGTGAGASVALAYVNGISGAYNTSGTFTSAVIDMGSSVGFSTLSAASSTPSGTTISFAVRAGNLLPLSGGYTNITNGNISAFAGNRYIQYQATLTGNTTSTPTIDSVTINHVQYTATSGNLTSSKYDIGSEAVISKLTWAASTSTTETVKFQMRSSADGNTWSNWCGASTACLGTDYFEDANNGVTITSGHPLRFGTGADADRYFQYKVFLASGGAATPTLTSVTVQYVVNAPPAVGNILPAQVTDSGSANYGKVSFNFDASDSDTSTGSPANQFRVTPSLYEYSTNGGGAWTTISSGLSANAYSAITLTADSATTTTTVVWTPSAGIALTSNAKIRVTISDGEAANFSATATSGTFTLDSTAPVVASTGGFLVDSSVGATGLAGIKLTATDDSTVQYRLCNNADFSADGLNSGVGKCAEWSVASTSVALATSTTSWNTTLTASSTEVVYMQVRDAYGNVTARTTTAPKMPTNFIATDTTNIIDGTYREFLSWGIGDASTFGSYKIWSKIGGAGSYSLLDSVSPVTLNYYTHTITTATSSEYFYKIATMSSNGDVSEFVYSTPDTPGGSGSADTTPPYILTIATSSIGNASANITFGTYTDTTMAGGELATSTVRYASYTGGAPTSCPVANSVSTNTYTVNHSVYLTGLNPSTNYVFCVLAKNIAGYVSTPSSVAAVGGTFTTVGGPVITGVTEREVTDTSATIFWNTDTSSDSKVYYAMTPAGVNGSTPVTGAAVTTSGMNANGTFYQHQIGLTGLSAGLTYYYKVVSVDTLSNTSTDNNLGQYYSFVTLKDTTPPTITGTSTPVLAPTAAVVVWQTNEPATTQVDYGTASGVYTKGAIDSSSNLSIYHVMTLSSATNNALGSGDNALTKEIPYYYRVTSKDAANNEATATGTFTTPADGNVTITMVNVVNSAGDTTKDTTAPSISNVKIADITPFGATASFDTNEDTVGFVDYGKDASYGASAGDKTWAKTHTVKLRGLALGTEYHIKVSAVDKAGNTGTGSDQTFKTTFLSENLKDMAKIENIEQFQKEIEDTIESILPSLVPPFVTKPVVTDITENSATVSFRTNIKSFPVVGFVEDALYDGAKENPYTGEVSDTTEKAVDHTVALVMLKQNTKYRLQARAFSLPKVIGKSTDITFTTKAAKISGSIIERKKDSFTVVWTTDEPTSSIVEYKNVASGVTERKTDDAKRTSHSMRVENLPSGTTYTVDISGINEDGNIAEAGAPLSVTTSRDVTAPVISGFKVDNALVPGRTDRIQTIVSWKTDEPANSTTYYEEGAGTAGDTKELANKNEVLDSYVVGHSVILPNLKPGTIYRLKVTSSDDSGNEASFGPRTVITPRQTESITDIIFKNFEDSFKFLRDI